MPSDDYVSVGGGGALKLKGAKVHKKKKKKSTKPDLEKNLELGGGESSSSKAIAKRDDNANDDHEDNGDAPERYKTETERRYEEARKKKVRRSVTTVLPLHSLMLTTHSFFKSQSNLDHGRNSSRHTKNV